MPRGLHHWAIGRLALIMHKMNSNVLYFNCAWIPCDVNSYLALTDVCYLIFPVDIFWKAPSGLVLNIVIDDHLGLLFMHSFCIMSISHTAYRFLIDSFREPWNYLYHYELSSRHILHGYWWLHMKHGLPWPVVITMSLSTAFYTGPLPYSFTNYLCIYDIGNHYWIHNHCWLHKNIVTGWGHWQPNLIVLLSIATSNCITHCGPVMPCFDIGLGQFWFQCWLAAIVQQAIAWTNVNKPSVSHLGNSSVRNDQDIYSWYDTKLLIQVYSCTSLGSMGWIIVLHVEFAFYTEPQPHS